MYKHATNYMSSTVNVGRQGMNGISSKVDLKLSSDKERSGKLTGVMFTHSYLARGGPIPTKIVCNIPNPMACFPECFPDFKPRVYKLIDLMGILSHCKILASYMASLCGVT